MTIKTNDGILRRKRQRAFVQVGDYNGDGSSDILWRNDSGAMAEWLMNGTTISQALTPTSGGSALSPGATWSPQEKPTNFG
ncbi:MAG: hypothetical protein JO237_07500 [Pseudolabrys sp.]|nr:hypothetical protein [Pseudolabrys sp.]